MQIAATFPAAAVREILDLGNRTLTRVLEGVTARLREHTAAPESEIEHFAALAHAS